MANKYMNNIQPYYYPGKKPSKMKYNHHHTLTRRAESNKSNSFDKDVETGDK